MSSTPNAGPVQSDSDPHVGFIVANPFHLFHHGAIRRYLGGKVSVYVEVRDDDFGITRSMIEQHMAPCEIKWIASDELKAVDGDCDVIVCHTPVPVLKFFTRSLVVAVQYSLAKEQYQYGIWRAQADLNLMYGNYSVAMVAPFSRAVAVGNPLFDEFVPDDGIVPLAEVSDRPRVLYMPTYGDLSDRAAVLRSLAAQEIELSIKAHHADFEIKKLAAADNIPLYLSDVNPIALIQSSDLVVSDYSGAIYDALAMRTPVALVGSVNRDSSDVGRLSAEDLSRSSTMGLTAVWDPEEPLHDAYSRSWSGLSDDAAYQAFISRFFVNFGRAGEAGASEIKRISTAGQDLSFAASQIREATRRYITRNRELQQQLTTAERSSVRALRALLKMHPPHVIAMKAARQVVRATPGVKQAVNKLRVLRARTAAGAPAQGSGARDGRRKKSAFSEIPHVRRSQLVELVQAALGVAGVAYRTDVSDYRAYIAVLDHDLDSLHRALRTLSVDDPAGVVFWLGTGAKYSTVRDTKNLGMHDLAASESFVVGVPFEKRNYSIQRNGGVEVLLLEQRGDRLVARRARAEKSDWTADFAAAGSEEPAGAGTASVDSVQESDVVDVVYTWVDSSDREWMAERAAASGESEIVMASAATDERYLDREELRYSLRSVAMYAPFVRNIYIVTHGHRPSWLVADNDRIRIVPHREIFPDLTVLPTFNSHSIEACLHRIPGLAENFLYFNDDFFLGRDVRFSDFYTKAGLIKSRFSMSSPAAHEMPALDAIPTDWASYNAIKLIHDEFGIRFDRKLKHVPYAMKKSMLDEMEERYPGIFARTRASRFRDHQDFAIPSMFSHFYGIATHQAVEWPNIPKEYSYADTGRADFRLRLDKILIDDPMFFCLNVTLHSDIDLATQTRIIKKFLGQRYPIPSPFEIPPSESS